MQRSRSIRNVSILLWAALPAAQLMLAQQANMTTSAESDQASANAAQEVVMDNLPPATAADIQSHPPVPRPRSGVSDAAYKARKAAANLASLTRPAINPGQAPSQIPNSDTTGTFTPGAFTVFPGQSESGLTPSDMGLAAGNTYVLQAVNATIAIYDKTGVLQTGYPKSLNKFFGLSSSAFTFDPRALYDWVNGRFIVMADENNSSTGQSYIHIAASATGNPKGAWNIYTLTVGAIGDFADFPTLGQDRKAIYVGFTNFLSAGGISNYVLYLPKTPIYSGAGFSYYYSFNFNVGGTNVDSIQPANVMAKGDSPRAEFMVNSFNINFGGGQCSSGCNGLVVWAVSNPLVASGSPGPQVTGVVIGTSNNYSLPPSANQLGSPNSVDTGDTRISGESIYLGGSVYAAINTAATGPGATVIWYRINPFLNDGNAACTGAFLYACAQITGATISEEECYYCGGRGNAGSSFYGVLQPDTEGNATLAYAYSDSSSYPGIAYTSKRVTALTLHDNGLYLQSGQGQYNQGRWGDYTGVAPDLTNPASISMWFSMMYSTSGGNWATMIGRNRFVGVAP